jgi:tetratricopeptide (TPR) repeat protein
VFAREVDENATMIDALSGALLWNVDCEKGEGIEIAKKYEIRGYPTYIAVNGEGEVTDSWIGYEGAEKWSASVLAAKKDRRTIAEKKTAFKAEPTLALARALGSNASTDSEYKDAVAYHGKAQELDPDNANEYRDLILMDMIYGMDDGAFTIDEVVAKAEPVMASEETPLADKLELAMMMKYMAQKTDQLDRAVPFIEAAYAASEGSTDETVLKYRGYMAVDHALLVEKDTAKALELFRGRLPEGWEEDPEQLNRFAWWCFENNVNLKEAQEMATKGVELAETDQEKANILDTAAEICNALDNCDEALAKIKLAVELNPENEHIQEQLVRFEKIVEEKNRG